MNWTWFCNSEDCFSGCQNFVSASSYLRTVNIPHEVIN